MAPLQFFSAFPSPRYFQTELLFICFSNISSKPQRIRKFLRQSLLFCIFFFPHFILAMYLCLPSTTTYITYQIRCRCLFCKPHVAFINNASTFSLSPISQHTYIQPLSASNCSFSDISLHALMNLNKKMLRFCLFFSWVKFINVIDVDVINVITSLTSVILQQVPANK